MAQTDDIPRENSTSQRIQNSFHFKRCKDQTSPTFQQLLQRDGSMWSRIPLQKQKNDHGQQRNGNYNNMKSVLSKVREKAKMLKIPLGRKKSHNENEYQYPSTAHYSGVGQQDKRVDDAKHHSTQIYGSKDKAETNKQEPKSITEKHSTTSNIKLSKYASSSNTITMEQTKNQASSGTSVVATDSDTKNKEIATTNAPKVHNSRFLGHQVSTPETSRSRSDNVVEKKVTMKSESQTREKGVSVKEYLMNKFEPGEDERALSKVITQIISPRRDKAREAMSSLLKSEEPSEVNNKNGNLNFKSKPTNLNTNRGSKIAYIKPSYSLASSSSNASSDLNQMFKSELALSKVNTQTISSRLKNEEPSEVNKSDAEKNGNLNIKSKSMPASTNLYTNIGAKVAYNKPSYSLGPGSSKAYLDLNQAYKSTFATYQNHFLGSSLKPNTSLIESASSIPNRNLGANKSLSHLNSPTKAGKSPLDNASSAKEIQTPAQDPVSRHTATSVRRVRVSSAYRNSVRSHVVSTDNQTRVPDQTGVNETRSLISIGNQG